VWGGSPTPLLPPENHLAPTTRRQRRRCSLFIQHLYFCLFEFWKRSRRRFYIIEHKQQRGHLLLIQRCSCWRHFNQNTRARAREGATYCAVLVYKMNLLYYYYHQLSSAATRWRLIFCLQLSDWKKCIFYFFHMMCAPVWLWRHKGSLTHTTKRTRAFVHLSIVNYTRFFFVKSQQQLPTAAAFAAAVYHCVSDTCIWWWCGRKNTLAFFLLIIHISFWSGFLLEI